MEVPWSLEPAAEKALSPLIFHLDLMQVCDTLTEEDRHAEQQRPHSPHLVLNAWIR